MSVTNKTKIYSELESAVYGGYVTDVSQVRGAVKLQAGTEDNGKVLKVVNGEYKNEFVVDDEIKKEFALSLQTGNNIISVPLNSTFLSGEKNFLYKFKEALGDKCNNIRCLYNNGSEIVQQTLIYDASTNTWSGDLDNIYPEYYYIVNMKESLYLSFVVQYLNPTRIGLSNPNRFLRLYKGNNYFGNPLQKDISLLDLPKYLKFRSGEPCEGDTIFIVSSQSNATYFIVYTNGSWSGHDEILNAYSHGIRYYRAGEDEAMLLWEQDDWGVPELTANYIRQKSTECNDYTDEQVGLKQDLLVPGKNIKTINGESLLGSGNIDLKIEGGSGVINDSTISPFAGFINLDDIIIENATFAGSGGSVVYSMRNKMFLLTDGVKYYKDWSNYSLYNTSNSTDISARADKLFSYNDSHYMVVNGILQDISNIESTLKAYTDSAAISVQNFAELQANNALTRANNYTDSLVFHFAGFVDYNNITVNNSLGTTKEGGEVFAVILEDNTHCFYYKVGDVYYLSWTVSTSSSQQYNKDGKANPSKIFYNERDYQHYMVVNGILQDVSNIESVLKSYADSVAATAASKAEKDANGYTDLQFETRIQLVSELPSEPTSGVLYLIPDE